MTDIKWKNPEPNTGIKWTMIFLDEEANVNESFYFALGHSDPKMLDNYVTDATILAAIQEVAEFNGLTFSSLEDLEEWYSDCGIQWGENWWMVCDALQTSFGYEYVIPFDHQWWLFIYKRSWQTQTYNLYGSLAKSEMAWHPTNGKAYMSFKDQAKAESVVKTIKANQITGKPAKTEVIY
jgi:hypothetical protein